MKQMVCSVCSYTYDEAKGIPEAGIAPGTKWRGAFGGLEMPVVRRGRKDGVPGEDGKTGTSRV